jgi:transglutaminase-like putative cysteine protease
LEPHAIEPRLPAGLDAEIAVAPGRLDACFTQGSEPRVTLSAQISLRTRPILPDGAALLDPAEAELYTRPREARLVVSPRIRALAAELSAGARDPDRIIDRFWAFLLDRLSYGMVHHDRLSDAEPLDAILQDGWYDCHLGSALFAALCRASGIPARLVGGYLLYPTAPSSHYWAEAWLADRGWVPFDLACWDLSAGGRDSSWRNRFFGRLDYRMKTEVMPRLFTGTPSLRFPAGWHRLQRLEPEGASVSFRALDSGALILRDRITVKA